VRSFLAASSDNHRWPDIRGRVALRVRSRASPRCELWHNQGYG